MPTLWHQSARHDLHAIRVFYRDIDPELASRILTAIFDTARPLTAFPQIGRAGRVRETRELPVKGTRFILAYLIKNGVPVVLTVFHTSRRWPVLWLTATIDRAKDTGSTVPQGDVETLFRESEQDDERQEPRSEPSD